MTIYFGTYTRHSSEGIYTADFNAKTGKLTNRLLLAKEPSPTYLALSEANYLYAVGAENDLGGIAAYTREGQLINHVVQEGAPLCYVSVDEERNLVYGANYHKGQVLVYKILDNGGLELTDSHTHEGHGPHKNQASAHVHYADLTPDNYLLTCDLGTDQIVTYRVSDAGKLTLLDTYNATPGAGPRHIVFHPTAKIAYLICELNSTIEVLIYDSVGQFELMQTISTLPDDFMNFNGTAAIRISADGKFVYASNRGHDSIAVYKTLGDASLDLVEIVPSLGQIPRDFILTKDQKYVIVAHQDSDNVTVFSRNAETGRLTELSHDFVVPEAVAILEMEC
ncbi:lactonase family protein [Streptococcus sp. X16XC17]|uniref:lactonase family protein n=1 Tax=unclassified Streptococcus TaxID=2608887 RepID=UPI00066FB7B8|nr:MULTISPECIES: lactonase family protein [unclassified Streptococcus]TCD46228.1 lactonase family protein [Streptococcus sp. X16XC17]